MKESLTTLASLEKLDSTNGLSLRKSTDLQPCRSDVLALAAQMAEIQRRSDAKITLYIPGAKGESASLVAAHIAANLAQIEDRKVLLMSFNESLTAPVIEGVGPFVSLTDFATQNSRIFVLRRREEDGNGDPQYPSTIARDPFMASLLDVIPNAGLAAFFAKAKSFFTHVVLDAPSVLDSGTGLVLAPLSDQTILTVAKRVSDMSQVKLSKKRLVGAGARLKGFIMVERPL